MLDDETQVDGFAELCGLQRHKPFECVGEIEESAAVMAHLGGHPDWRDDAVVRRLHAAFRRCGSGSGEFRALFAFAAPHRVPDRFMAMLDACG